MGLTIPGPQTHEEPQEPDLHSGRWWTALSDGDFRKGNEIFPESDSGEARIPQKEAHENFETPEMTSYWRESAPKGLQKIRK